MEVKKRILLKILFPICFLLLDGCNTRQEIKPEYSGVGRGNSVAIDSKNLTHVAYADDTNLAVKYAFFDGSEWNIESVETLYSGKKDPGLAYAVWVKIHLVLDAEDKPHLLYYDVFSGKIKYAKKVGSDWLIDIVDDVTSEGGHSNYLDPSSEFEHRGFVVGSFVLNLQSQPRVIYWCIGSSVYVPSSYDESHGGNLKFAWWDGTKWHIDNITEELSVCAGNFSIDSLDNIKATLTINNELRYAIWDGNSWQDELIESEQEYALISLDSNNMPFLLIHTLCNPTFSCLKEPKFGYKNGQKWVIELIDDGYANSDYDRNIGGFLLDKQDRPVFIYSLSPKTISEDSPYQGPNGILQIGLKENSEWRFEKLGGETIFGFDPSIAVDSNNIYHICYVNNSVNNKPGVHETKATLYHAVYDGSKWSYLAIDQ